jgi:hypothetical protein
VAAESLAELGETVAAARDEDANLLARRDRSLEAHGVEVLSVWNGSTSNLRSCALVRPSARTVPDHSKPSGLSAASVVGLRLRDQSPLVKIQKSFWACASVTGELDRLVAVAWVTRLLSPEASRSLEHEDVAQDDARDLLVLDPCQLPRADHVDVVTGRERPTRSWFASPGIWNAGGFRRSAP